MALELLQPLSPKQLSNAIAAAIASGEFDRTKRVLRAVRFRKANRKNYRDFNGGAIAVLND